ncbi:MAG TPA: hypothetical protein VKA21_04405 [Candidatus Binatia bacterium]|nr:hypothetical protein [Candidatus Binatia bacterium]
MIRTILVFGGVALLAVIGAATHADGASKATCRAQCRSLCTRECRRDFYAELETSPLCRCKSCPDCPTGPLTERLTCVATAATNDFSACIAECHPLAGHCALTRDCLDDCRRARAAGRGACERALHARLQKCPGCLSDARGARRECIQTCRSACGTACRSTATAVSEVVPPSAAAPAAACLCQTRCVLDLVSSCYADCADRCEGDRLALGICQRGCRDAQCSRLEAACTDGETATKAYRDCCTRCDTCSDALAPRLECGS